LNLKLRVGLAITFRKEYYKEYREEKFKHKKSIKRNILNLVKKSKIKALV